MGFNDGLMDVDEASNDDTTKGQKIRLVFGRIVIKNGVWVKYLEV